MIDHVSVRVKDFGKAKQFYLAALGPLGYQLIADFGKAGGFGEGGKPDFWVGEREEVVSSHIAFAAKDRKAVDAFHQAAIAAGGKDNGKPGVREHYHKNYYAAFIYDLDGNNIEVVCHT